MSLSRQLRRAAERAQRKEEQKAIKNNPDRQQSQEENVLKDSLANATEPDLSAVRPAETFDTIATGAAVCPRFFSSSSASTPEPARASGPAGPRTPKGKAISCLNNLKHGLTGAFRVLQFESQSDFDAAHEALIAEHDPTTPTESQLIRRMAEYAWLSRRAQLLQDKALMEDDEKRFSLYMRYQTTNDRGFRACLTDLFRVRREQRAAAREFESQRRAAELHEARVRLANAKAGNLEIDTGIRSTVDAPIPGYSSVPVERMKDLFKSAMLSLKYDKGGKAAA